MMSIKFAILEQTLQSAQLALNKFDYQKLAELGTYIGS